MNKQYIRIGSIDITYHETGYGDQQLLFIHGNSLSSDIFIEQLHSPELQKKFKLYAIDMAGHGDSARSITPEKDYSIASQAKLIVDFCKVLRIKNPVIVGHSLGGNIVIEAIKTINPRFLLLVGAPPAENPMNQDMFLPNAAIPHFLTPELSEEDLLAISKALLAPNSNDGQFFLDIIKKSDPLTRTTVYQSLPVPNMRIRLRY